MAFSPPAPPSQPGTRVFSDAVDQVFRFIQQPSSNSRNAKSASAKHLNSDFNYISGAVPSPDHSTSYQPAPMANAQSTHEHEASPLSPSRTLVASDSSSSTPKSRYKPLRRTESSGSTNSSTSRSTEIHGRSVDGRKGTGFEKVEKRNRMNVSERLRRLGKKMQSQKSSLSSPKVSAGELTDDSDSGLPIRPSSAAYTSAVSSRVHPTTETRPNLRPLQTGKGKERQQYVPGAHAKLLSMVVEADESASSSTFSPSSGSGATTPTLVQTPVRGRTIKNLTPGLANDDDRGRDDPPEPMTLAARIQALISGLPFPSLTRPVTVTPNTFNPPETPLTSANSPQFYHSPQLFSSSSPLPMSPPHLPSSPLPAVPQSYDVNLNVEMDAEGRPIPPPYASPLPPRERMLLEEFLSSPVIMNGELPQEGSEKGAQGAARDKTEGVSAQAKQNPKPAARVTRSIWSVLESMGTNLGKSQASSSPTSPPPPLPAQPSASNAPTSSATPQQQPAGPFASPNENESMYSDTGSSVMIYSPLIPSGAQDLPELAEVVPVIAGGPGLDAHDSTAESSGSAVAAGAEPGATETLSSWIPSSVRQWSFVQAIATWSTTPAADSSASMQEGTGSIATLSSSTSAATATPGGNPPPSGGITTSPAVRKAWVPSTTKMSVQAMWWGYRLYLPPPVMAILSDRTLEASKRAALITSALTWFFTNLPVTALPPLLQPAALLLQRIAPFLGYIGAFISWSWGVIEGYDVGYGVTLTATWLLPVALIPGTWHKDEFPVSPAALGQPVPLPQILYSPAPASERSLEPLRTIQIPAGPMPARVTEFLPLPTTPSTEPPSIAHTPVSTTPLLPSRGLLQSSTPPSPFHARPQSVSPLMTPVPTPPTPISPSATPRPRREPDLIPATPPTQSMPSTAPTSPSNYQTPLLSSPALTNSSHYYTPLLSPLVLPSSPLLPSSAHRTPSAYQAMPIPESIPASPSQKQTYAPLASPLIPVLAASPSSPPQTPRPRPQSMAKSSAAGNSIPAPTSTDSTPPRSPGPRRTPKVTTSSANQAHPATRPSSHVPLATPRPIPAEIASTTPRTTPHGITPRKPTAPSPSDTQANTYPNPAPSPMPVPVGSQLEQHLLSGPLMSPIALPDVDLPEAGAVAPALPTSVPTISAQTTASAFVPVNVYSDKEERQRERERDKARIRERARAIFRRTSAGASGTQKAKA